MIRHLIDSLFCANKPENTNMKQQQFKTTINCKNCVRTVSGFLNDVPGIDHWEVDTTDTDKILTVSGEALDMEAIIEAVEDAGFEIQPMEQA